MVGVGTRKTMEVYVNDLQDKERRNEMMISNTETLQNT